VALIRAVVKRPAFLILNGMGGGPDAADAELRERARRESGGAALIFAASGMDATRGADHVLRIGDDGTARLEPVARAEGGAGPGLDGGDERA
jgi:putative ABC transport system ATP-binding protein